MKTVAATNAELSDEWWYIGCHPEQIITCKVLAIKYACKGWGDKDYAAHTTPHAFLIKK